MNHVAALTKELQVYQAAQSLLPASRDRQDEVIQTDQKGEVPQQTLPADFATLMSEVGQLREKLDASIRSNRELSKELKKKLKDPLRTQAKTRATQVSAPCAAASSVDDTTTISSAALTSQHSQAEGTRPSGAHAGKKDGNPARPKEEPMAPLSSSAPMLHKGEEVSTPRKADGKSSSFAGRPSNITFQHPAAYSTPYPHRLAYSDSDEPLTSDAYLPTGGAQQGGIPKHFPEGRSLTMDRSIQHASKDDKAVQFDSGKVLGTRPARLFQGETQEVASGCHAELSGPTHEKWGWGTERRSMIPRPTGHAAPAATHSVRSKVSRGVQHSRVSPDVVRFTVPLRRGAAVSEGTQSSLHSSVGVQSGPGARGASAQTSRMVSEGTQAVRYSSSVGEEEPMESYDSTLTWSRVSAGQSSPLRVTADDQWGTGEVGHQETLMKRKSSPLRRPVHHSSHSQHSPSHRTNLSHGSLPEHPSQQTDGSDAESTATFSTFASEADQVVSVKSVVSQTRDSGGYMALSTLNMCVV